MPEWAWPSNNNWRISCVSRFYVNKNIKQTYKGGLHFTVICCTNKCIINERYIPEHQNKLNIEFSIYAQPVLPGFQSTSELAHTTLEHPDRQRRITGVKFKLKTNLYSAIKSEDSEALDGGTSQMSSQREYGEIKLFWGGL